MISFLKSICSTKSAGLTVPDKSNQIRSTRDSGINLTKSKGLWDSRVGQNVPAVKMTGQSVKSKLTKGAGQRPESQGLQCLQCVRGWLSKVSNGSRSQTTERVRGQVRPEFKMHAIRGSLSFLLNQKVSIKMNSKFRVWEVCAILQLFCRKGSQMKGHFTQAINAVFCVL